jgi:hypothetical protein
MYAAQRSSTLTGLRRTYVADLGNVGQNASEGESTHGDEGGPAEAGEAISLPPPASGRVEGPAAAARSEQTPTVADDPDSGPSENALRRQAFERLTEQASGGPPAPSMPPAQTPKTAGPTPPMRQEQTPGGGPQRAAPGPLQTPQESAARRAAFEQLRSQAEQRETTVPPSTGDESARRRSELENILGEQVSPPSPPEAEKEDGPGRAPETPSDSGERRDAFEHLRAQAAGPNGSPSPPREVAMTTKTKRTPRSGTRPSRGSPPRGRVQREVRARPSKMGP